MQLSRKGIGACQETGVLVLVLLLPSGDRLVLLTSVDIAPSSPRGPEQVTSGQGNPLLSKWLLARLFYSLGF